MEIKNIQNQQQEAFIQNLEKGFMVSNGVYADNFLNRKLGRVGQPYKKLSERIEDKKDLKKSKYLADLKWTVDRGGSKNGRGGEVYFDCPQGRLYAGRHGYYIKTKEDGEETYTNLSENEAYNFVTSKDWESKNSLLIEKQEKKEAKLKEKKDKDETKRSLYLRDLEWKKDDNGERYVQTKGGPLFAGRHSYYIYDNDGPHDLSEDDAFLYAHGQSSELKGESKNKILEKLTDKLSDKSYKKFKEDPVMYKVKSSKKSNPFEKLFK